jgi:hypothetical protein
MSSPEANEAQRAEIAALIKNDFDVYFPQLEESLRRVGKLVSLAGRLSDSALGEAAHMYQAEADDVLRAAVVLTHSCFEDFLRTLANRLLPECDEAVLKEIPLAGYQRGKSQFHLGQLVSHKHKTVDELIRQSVTEFLDRSTFNNTTEVARLLEDLHLMSDTAKGFFPELDGMMSRRHQIVHRTDRVKMPDSDGYALAPISAPEVMRWLHTTNGFVVAVVSRIAAESVIKALENEPKPETPPHTVDT